jgi:hypothetical protein
MEKKNRCFGLRIGSGIVGLVQKTRNQFGHACFLSQNKYYVQKLGAKQDQIEIFISNLANSPEPEKLIDIANQIAQISTSESISPEKLGNRVKQQQEE